MKNSIKQKGPWWENGASPGKRVKLHKMDFFSFFLEGKNANPISCMLLPRETLADAKKELSPQSSVNRGKKEIKMITYV